MAGIDEKTAAGMEIFRQFVFDGQLTEAEKKKIITEADRLGRERAQQIRMEFGDRDPEELLKEAGIEVISEGGTSKYNSDYVKFAEFYAKKGQIRLNAYAVRKLDKKLEPGLAKNIILCHELYHYFEISRWGNTSDLFVRTVRLFGWIPARRRILPAAEIAADSFAETYLKLDFNPRKIEALYFEP